MMNAEISGEEGLQLLGQEVSRHAMKSALHYGFHSASEKQTEILQQISSSMHDAQPQINRILWVCGRAGSGKTSLAQALVDHWQTSKRLGGSFFFPSGVQGRAEANRLFPTIAYQLAMNVPDLRKSINDVVSHDRNLLSKSIFDQFKSLIVAPMQELVAAPSKSYIIVIDGLDVCAGPDGTLPLILRCLGDSVQRFKLPFFFLVTSRPEPQICQVFDSDILHKVTLRISLPGSHSGVAQSSSFPSEPRDETVTRRPSRPARKRPFLSPSYPRIVTLQQRNGHAETYCRSLLLSGHGFPIWRPSGDLAMPAEILKRGVSIGDVGSIDKHGFFQYFFNVFHSPDDPINVNFTPREFHPIEPALQPDEIVYEEEHFKPGHVVASKGVVMMRHSESPLDIYFSSTEPEGAILVLPSGASRQDLVSTTRFHEYARKNAPHWYQFINNYGGITDANGSLFLVTGCDKTNDWAIASFPYRAGNTTTKLDLRYTWKSEREPPWIDPGTADTNFYGPPEQVKNFTDEKNQCLFVRGLRISLTQQSWRRTLPYPELGRLHYSLILHTPSKFHLWLDSILVFLRLRLSEKRALQKISAQEQHFFHPNYIIGQVLLAEYPDSEVAIVDDSVWCSLVQGDLCTLSQMNELVTKVLSLNKIVEKDGIISLLPKTSYEMVHPFDRPATFKILHQKLSFSVPGSRCFSHTEKKPIQWVKTAPAYKHAKLF